MYPGQNSLKRQMALKLHKEEQSKISRIPSMQSTLFHLSLLQVFSFASPLPTPTAMDLLSSPNNDSNRHHRARGNEEMDYNPPTEANINRTQNTCFFGEKVKRTSLASALCHFQILHQIYYQRIEAVRIKRQLLPKIAMITYT